MLQQKWLSVIFSPSPRNAGIPNGVPNTAQHSGRARKYSGRPDTVFWERQYRRQPLGSARPCGQHIKVEQACRENVNVQNDGSTAAQPCSWPPANTPNTQGPPQDRILASLGSSVAWSCGLPVLRRLHSAGGAMAGG